MICRVKDITKKREDDVNRFLLWEVRSYYVEIQYVLEDRDGNEWTGCIHERRKYIKEDDKCMRFVEALDKVCEIQTGDTVEFDNGLRSSHKAIFPILRV